MPSYILKCESLSLMVDVDAGPTGFPSNVTASRGPRTGPRTEAGGGAASVTPDPSRIG
jgi:hypothetical protein